VKKRLAIAALFTISAQIIFSAPVKAQPCDLPDSKAVMVGLSSVSVRATSTEDAKKALKSIGQKVGPIESQMVSLIKERLDDEGFEVNSDDPKVLGKSHAELLANIYTDQMSGTVKIRLCLNELVSLVRSPENKVICTTWQHTANPRSNETRPMVQTAGTLTEEFLADYLEANPHRNKKR